MQKQKRSRKKAFIVLLVIALLIPAALYRGPVTRKYEIYSDKINGTITIAVVADLHNQNFGENQNKIIDKLINASPDIILMPGDMTNSPYTTDAMSTFIEQAVNIAPCYYVTGNHEVWSYESSKICDIISSMGVTVLHSDKLTLDINDSIVELYGIDDAASDYFNQDYQTYKWAQRLNDMWSENTENSFRILMSHRPEKTEIYQQYEYDLIVSGHSHGGLVRVPLLLNGLYAPDQGFFPKYAGGKYPLNDVTTMVVSRGLYNYKFMPRVFNPSEVVIITLFPSS